MTARKTKQRVVNLVSSGGVVYRKRNGVETVLCGRVAPERWSLAKGTPDAGETLEETAVREVREETGLDVEIEDKIGSIEYWFADRDGESRYHKRVHFYLMVSKGGSIQQHDPEFDIVEWFPIEEALEKLAYANEAEVMRQAISIISKSKGHQ